MTSASPDTCVQLQRDTAATAEATVVYTQKEMQLPSSTTVEAIPYPTTKGAAHTRA